MWLSTFPPQTSFDELPDRKFKQDLPWSYAFKISNKKYSYMVIEKKGGELDINPNTSTSLCG